MHNTKLGWSYLNVNSSLPNLINNIHIQTLYCANLIIILDLGVVKLNQVKHSRDQGENSKTNSQSNYTNTALVLHGASGSNALAGGQPRLVSEITSPLAQRAGGGPD